MVQVLLYATLRSYGIDGQASFQLDMPAGSKVMDIIEKLSIPIEEVKLVMINGVLNEVDTELKEGDRVGIFPPVGGG